MQLESLVTEKEHVVLCSNNKGYYISLNGEGINLEGEQEARKLYEKYEKRIINNAKKTKK